MQNIFRGLSHLFLATLVLFTTIFSQLAAHNSCDYPYPCENDCGSFVLGADWLYWKANATGLSYGTLVKTTNVPNAFLPINATSSNQIKDLSFDWDSGLRLYAGWTAPSHNWDGMLKWTHFNTSASGSNENNLLFSSSSPLSIGDSELFLLNWTPTEFVSLLVFGGEVPVNGPQETSAKWKMDLNTADLEIGRNFLLCNCVAIRSYAALRYVKLDQKYNLNSTFESTESESSVDAFKETISLKTNFQGIGVKGGLDTNWCFDCFRLYGRVGASLVYGRFDLNQFIEFFIQENPENPTSLFPIKMSSNSKRQFHSTCPISDVQLGIGWEQPFNCDSMNLSIKLGWEHHYFWKQNQFIKGSAANRFITPSIGNTSLGGIGVQGITLSALFEF